MKKEYSVRFEHSDALSTVTYPARFHNITNRVRSEFLKLGEMGDYTKDMAKLDTVMRFLLVADDVTFIDAFMEDCDAVITDFFGLFPQRTNE